MKYNLSLVRHHAQRRIFGYKFRNAVAAFFASFQPKMSTKLVGAEKADFTTLENKGFLALPSLVDRSWVDDLWGKLEGKKVYDRYDKRKQLFSPDNPPPWARTGSYLYEDIINIPEIIDLANDVYILKMVAAYLKCKPTLSNITLWHSYPTADKKAKDSENYHRDIDDLKFIKVFVYLSNVSIEDGPHIFIDGSHKDNKFTAVRRYTDDEVESAYDTTLKRIVIGKLGDGFIESTYGIHKGLVPLRPGRAVLQFEYSIFPIGAYDYSRKINETQKFTHDKYINRLLIS